jgi:polysaccharide export outer membrane protein
MVGHSNSLTAPDSESPEGSSGTDAIPVADGNGAMESIKVDLVSATKSGTGNYQILDGGVVSIEKRDPEPLHVLGLVHKPGRYDFPIGKDLRVTEAIALAGGTSMTVADKIFVVRRVPKSSETAVIQISYRQTKRDSSANLRLEPGDVVSVESTPATALYEAFNFMRFNIGAALPLTGVF